jgi:hypothetical protein
MRDLLASITGPWLTKILGGIILAQTLALAFVMVRADAISSQRDVAIAQANTEAANHRTTKGLYAAAQATAARLQAERNAAIAAAQQEITDAARQAHDDSLASIRASYNRLLAQARANAARPARHVRVPLTPSASGQPDEASDPQELPATGSQRDPIDQLERDLIATEQAHQLDALIAWVNAQLASQPKKP